VLVAQMMAGMKAACPFLLVKVKECEVFINTDFNPEGAM
jgi:hypothetical protein